MQRRGIDIKKATGGYKGRQPKAEADTVKTWRAENGKTIAETVEHFQISPATVKRYCAA